MFRLFWTYQYAQVGLRKFWKKGGGNGSEKAWKVSQFEAEKELWLEKL